MKQSRTQWQKARRCLFWTIAGLALGLVLLPAWFPWACRPVLRHYGLHYRDYDRLGYGRFMLRGVEGQWQQTQLHVEQVECVLPTAWAWQRLFPDTNRGPGLILSNGILTVSAGTNAPTVMRRKIDKIDSSYEVLSQIDGIGHRLQQYLPRTQLTNCSVVVHSTRLALPQAEWRNGGVRARVETVFLSGAVDLEAKPAGRELLAFSLSWEKQQLRLDGTFSRALNQWSAEGKIGWRTNGIGFTGHFSTNGWWPAQARFEGRQIRVPAELLRLQGYQDLTAELALEFVTNLYTLQATATAQPQASQAGWRPPFTAAVRAHGDPDSLTFDQFHLEAPWLSAQLTDPIGIRRTGEWRDAAARLQISMDLGQLPGESVTGKLSGQVVLELITAGYPRARFEIAGADLGGWGIEAQAVGARGEMDWPELTLDEATVRLPDRSQLQAKGAFDFEARTLRDASWNASGTVPHRFLGGWNCGVLETTGTAHGPLTHLVYEGSLTAKDLQRGPLNPLRIAANWKGTGLQLSSVLITAAAGNSEMSVGGAADLSAVRQRQLAGTIQSATLRRQGETLYTLQQPCPIEFRATPADATQDWDLVVDGFDWRGAGGELAVDTRLAWPTRGTVEVSATAAEQNLFADFVSAGISNIAIPQLALKAHWSNGPVQLSVDGSASIVDRQGREFSARARLSAGETLEIQELTARSQFAPALTVTGALPLQVRPTRGPGWLVVDPQGTIALQAHSETNLDEIAFELGSLGSLQILQPRLEVRASGTVEKPEAALWLGARRLNRQAPTNDVPMPQLNQLEIHGRITPDLVELRSLAVRLDEQPMEASGRWPLPAGFWKELWSKRAWPDWREASGRLKIEDAQVAALSRYFPKLLAPEGQINLDLALAEGGTLHGWLTLTNGSTRPLGWLSPLRDIAARVRLDGSQAVLDEFRGNMGGQPLEATGQVSFPRERPLEYQVRLEGSNVPLARSLEFLLRGDLNLSLRGGPDAPPILSGDVNLHNGLFVRYASDFLWSGPRRPRLRAPYFSLTNQPVAGWKLDVNIQGDHFLRASVPFFSGVASVDMKLGGTLQEPVLTGDARINSGRVMFPFGTLRVQEAYASLSGNDPRGPNLQLRATGQTLNYDVHLDVTGPLDGANVMFSSTPPLNSEEILLLLTAGEVPQNQYTFTTEAKASRLASFLGKDLFARYSGSTGVEERLIITSGEAVSEEGKLTYSVEYQLTDRWSIRGEYDRFNDYNADLRWKILSR